MPWEDNIIPAKYWEDDCLIELQSHALLLPRPLFSNIYVSDDLINELICKIKAVPLRQR